MCVCFHGEGGLGRCCVCGLVGSLPSCPAAMKGAGGKRVHVSTVSCGGRQLRGGRRPFGLPCMGAAVRALHTDWACWPAHGELLAPLHLLLLMHAGLVAVQDPTLLGRTWSIPSSLPTACLHFNACSSVRPAQSDLCRAGGGTRSATPTILSSST